MTSLDDVRRASERLRRLPESRWRQAPMPPLGARAPQAAPDAKGPTLERHVRDAVALLMDADARARGVRAFDIDVPVFSLADVLEALAKSVSASGDENALRALDGVARETRYW